MSGFWSAGLGASAIPDSVTNRWPHVEGSGSTLGDSIGTLDMSISGATWVSGDGADGYHLDYNGSGDVTSVSVSNEVESETQSVYGWFNPDGFGGERYFVSADTPDGFGAWWIRSEDGTLSANWLGLSAEVQSSSITSNAWQFIGASLSRNGALDVYLATASDQSIAHIGSDSVADSNPRSTDNFYFSEDGSYNGQSDDVYYVKGTKFIESDFQSEFDRTKGNYS